MEIMFTLERARRATYIGETYSDLIVLGVSLFLLKRMHGVSGLPCLVSSCLPISELLKFKLFAGFLVRVWFFHILEQTAQNIQKRRQATLLLLLMGCKQAVLQCQG